MATDKRDVKMWEEAPGVASSRRFVFLLMAFVATAVVLTGLYAFVVERPDAMQLVGAGLGSFAALIPVMQWAKTIEQRGHK